MAVGRIGAILGPYATGLIVASGGQMMVFTVGATVFLLAALAVFFLTPETKGKILDEIG